MWEQVYYALIICNAQVVQEYERAVIFRLGRLLPVGAKGPGEDVLIEANIFVYSHSAILPVM